MESALAFLKKSITFVLVFITAFLVGRFFSPKRFEEKKVEKVVYVDRVVTKEEKNVTKKVTKKRSPDGTVITETEIVDKSKTDTDSSHKITQEIVTQKSVSSRPDWRVGVTYKPTLFGQTIPQYGLMLERRIFGELYVGGILSTAKDIHLVVSIGF